jgi:hypothetical protein
LHRDAQCEGAAASYDTVDFELGMVSVSDGFADRETKAGTTRVAAARIVSAIESVKDSRQMFGRDASTGVGDRKYGIARFDTGAKRDATFRGRVIERVGEEIQDNLSDAARVRPALCGRGFACERDTAFFGEGLEQCNSFASDVSEVAVFQFQRRFAGIPLGEFEQRFRELPQAAGGANAVLGGLT